jgi:PIN domain nuclease of toxin-antitoxin system
LILLDTHVLLWFDRHDTALGQETIAQVTHALAIDALAASAISFWEVALLLRKRRLALRLPVEEWRRDFLEQGLIELPLTGAIAIAAVQLERLHRDPADRIIVATARDRAATLYTSDQAILDWPGRLDRRDARI